MRWYDNKAVQLACNYLFTELVDTDPRWSKKKRKNIYIWMLIDHILLRSAILLCQSRSFWYVHSLYHLEHKSRKLCVRTFYWILSSAVINGWARHCKKHRNFTAICWCENFVERRSFFLVLGESPKTMRKLCLSTKFPHKRKLGEITVFL